jgi:hypothetical protein
LNLSWVSALVVVLLASAAEAQCAASSVATQASCGTGDCLCSQSCTLAGECDTGCCSAGLCVEACVCDSQAPVKRDCVVTVNATNHLWGCSASPAASAWLCVVLLVALSRARRSGGRRRGRPSAGVLGLSLMLAAPVFAQARTNAAAQAAYAEAIALLRAELWGDALQALDTATTQAPDWPDPYLLRARTREELTPTTTLSAPAARFDAAFDYRAGRTLLAPFLKDCQRFLSLVDDGPDKAAGQAVCEPYQKLLRALIAAEAQGQAELRNSQKVEEARQAALEVERLEHARQAQVAVAAKPPQVEAPPAQVSQPPLVVSQGSERELATLRGQRVMGVAMTVVGVGLGAGAVGLYAMSNGKISDLQTGNVATGADFAGVATQAGTLQSAALGMALGSGALLVSGILTIVLSRDPTPIAGVSLTASASGGAIGFAGRLP